MKWATAVRTVEQVAERCGHVAAQPPGIVRLRVTEAWLWGPLLGPAADEVPDAGGVGAALVCDATAEDCAWGTAPPGAGQWLAASGLAKRPVRLVFRPAGQPVWNHAVVRPVRFWSLDEGPDEAVVAAVRAGEGGALRPPAPAPVELAQRLEQELAASLAAVRRTSADHDAHRWSPGSPLARADALADAVRGHLELLDASAAAARG
ncbi:hypothetical protein MO973_36930 [Paenibacillus sp. TRM 82003]|uniref:DUF7711 family protein n=1 Tax=Kineococcus sp. TRM81007 TaxID=2925831 RepID=UPI001F591F32|nr:hypothetical protein [Kineococcus sp. TRM81007]MCI2239899.1 hypothetical protein [Kineococcus sp. TRM81007]MCI3925797.1 hypothetical protein [Paenibacillus sp. TRM 82003]